MEKSTIVEQLQREGKKQINPHVARRMAGLALQAGDPSCNIQLNNHQLKPVGLNCGLKVLIPAEAG